MSGYNMPPGCTQDVFDAAFDELGDCITDEEPEEDSE